MGDAADDAYDAATREPDDDLEWMEADECDCADKAPAGQYWVCPKCDAEWHGDEDQ